ncbi:DNA-directed RNA polymerase subunit beta [Paramicrobacterium chengjingii]|uniref:DNA-directed RNA polymerase subunit beta n=1 Tax=Paramicrobacterium chengjingii TaxID=2769067 RepID=A0ABX6YF07_9MICO|nr:DNA-directed RNA polymerase subunit beta [Microbacterium chengjingii]QPZ37393.1 DNA-directed RNA polymerase subunit beta [Microbacterium chengjingii]
MPRDFHKPARYPASVFDNIQGGIDPAESSRIAHETARALLARVRDEGDPDIVERVVAYTDEHGIDTIAELWSHATSRSLPGSLWRIYLLRLQVREDPHGTGLVFQRGSEVLRTIDPVVAGAPAPTGPAEIIALADRILRGIFEGDFTIALDRAAAYCRVSAAGCTSIADDFESTEPERASDLTQRALRLSTYASDLASAARLWRRDELD